VGQYSLAGENHGGQLAVAYIWPISAMRLEIEENGWLKRPANAKVEKAWPNQ